MYWASAPTWIRKLFLFLLSHSRSRPLSYSLSLSFSICSTMWRLIKHACVWLPSFHCKVRVREGATVDIFVAAVAVDVVVVVACLQLILNRQRTGGWIICDLSSIIQLEGELVFFLAINCTAIVPLSKACHLTQLPAQRNAAQPFCM